MKGVPGASRRHGDCHRHKETQKSSRFTQQMDVGLVVATPCASRLLRGQVAVDVSFRGMFRCPLAQTGGGFLLVRVSVAGRRTARMAPTIPEGRGLAFEGQPPAELLRGLVGRVPIERHHRAGSARHPRDLGAPPIRPTAELRCGTHGH